MSKTYGVFFKFVDPFNIEIEADDPNDAVRIFYEEHDFEDLMDMLVMQGFQGAEIDTTKVVDLDTGEKFPLDPKED